MGYEVLSGSRGDGSGVLRPNAQRVLADLTSERVSNTRDGAQLSYRVAWDAASVSNSIRSNEGIAFLEGLITNFDEPANRYLIGLFLSSISAGLLSDEARDRLAPIVDSQDDVTILPFFRDKHKSWELCADSEGYLIESIERNATILAGDTLLIKDDGRKAGLCLETTSTPSGTFLAGSWYEPIDQEGVKLAFRQNIRRISLDGEWVHLNDISVYHADYVSAMVMREAQKHADRLR